MIRAVPQPQTRRNPFAVRRHGTRPVHGRNGAYPYTPAQPRDPRLAYLTRVYAVDRGVARELLASLEAAGQAQRLYPEALAREACPPFTPTGVG